MGFPLSPIVQSRWEEFLVEHKRFPHPSRFEMDQYVGWCCSRQSRLPGLRPLVAWVNQKGHQPHRVLASESLATQNKKPWPADGYINKRQAHKDCYISWALAEVRASTYVKAREVWEENFWTVIKYGRADIIPAFVDFWGSQAFLRPVADPKEVSSVLLERAEDCLEAHQPVKAVAMAAAVDRVCEGTSLLSQRQTASDVRGQALCQVLETPVATELAAVALTQPAGLLFAAASLMGPETPLESELVALRLLTAAATAREGAYSRAAWVLWSSAYRRLSRAVPDLRRSLSAEFLQLTSPTTSWQIRTRASALYRNPADPANARWEHSYGKWCSDLVEISDGTLEGGSEDFAAVMVDFPRRRLRDFLDTVVLSVKNGSSERAERLWSAVVDTAARVRNKLCPLNVADFDSR